MVRLLLSSYYDYYHHYYECCRVGFVYCFVFESPGAEVLANLRASFNESDVKSIGERRKEEEETDLILVVVVVFDATLQLVRLFG